MNTTVYVKIELDIHDEHMTNHALRSISNEVLRLIPRLNSQFGAHWQIMQADTLVPSRSVAMPKPEQN